MMMNHACESVCLCVCDERTADHCAFVTDHIDDNTWT